MLFDPSRHTLRVLPSSFSFLSRGTFSVAAASLVVLCSSNALQNAVANGDTRTLSLHHTHSGEDLTVTFKRDGRYDEDGLAKLNHLLRDWRDQQQTKMDPRLFDVVWEAYQEVGARAPVHIISAYRSPGTNAMLRRRSHGVAQFSQHMLGKAMDFFIPGVSLENIRFAGLRLQRGGVGYYPTSGSPFVHLDVGSVRHWPRMSRDQLARVFPSGRTVHVPADGRPMPGYALALADIERRGSSTPSRMSLASAQSSGAVSGDERLGGRPKRSLLASLFGAREETDEESEGAAPAPRARAQENAPAARPAAVAAAIPLPRVRPPAIDRAPATVLAAAPQAPAPVMAWPPLPAPQATASAAPTPPAAAGPSPAQVVQARGLWRSADVLAAAEGSPEKPSVATAQVSAPAAGSRRERLVWQVGAQPVGSAAVRKTDPQGSRKRVELASASPEITGTLPQWPGETAEDRASSTMVMAYAEPAADRAALRGNPAPMGSVRPNATAGRAAQNGRAGQPRPLGQLVDKPWLRGLMLSPSVHNAMGVAVMGVPNYREIAQLMHKPTSVVAMAFSSEDSAEPGAEAFTGRAVAFVPIHAFARRTAGLN